MRKEKSEFGWSSEGGGGLAGDEAEDQDGARASRALQVSLQSVVILRTMGRQ